MELALFVYLAGILIPIKTALVFILIMLLTYGMFYSLDWDYERDCGKPAKPYNKAWMKWLVSITFVLALIPSERTAYTMAGAYAVQKIVEHPSTEEVSRKVIDVINMKLDNHLKEKQ